MDSQMKRPDDILTNRNGFVMDISIDNSLIGQPDQQFNPWMPLSTGDMRRGGSPQIFDNNGSSNKGEAGGTINKNGEYGPLTFGF